MIVYITIINTVLFAFYISINLYPENSICKILLSNVKFLKDDHRLLSADYNYSYLHSGITPYFAPHNNPPGHCFSTKGDFFLLPLKGDIGKRLRASFVVITGREQGGG